ncbi:MAG: NERD domain-containing protein/DEAD/DEAH box helicase [Anaerolineae bacterium]|nr:NERD domain-containing protein/DEAD/DEAH box helicase [Anaerolineae bacterium]
MSPAERRLFNLFRDSLNNDFIVFWHVAWLHRASAVHDREGEADFIIAHPEHGILVLEVKGGEICYDATDGRWVSTTNSGQKHAIHDPFEQARRAQHSLLTKIRESDATRRFRYRLGYGVCFPDVEVDVEALRLDAPRAIVLDAQALREPERSLLTLFHFWSEGHPPDPLGSMAIDGLSSLLARSWRVTMPLHAALAQGEEQIRELTERQFALLDFMSRQRRAAICGCAGSGKTFLAMEKAQRLAREGFRVLLTCYNRNLADWMRASLRHIPALTISNYHRLALDWAHRAGVSASGSRSLRYYSESLPAALAQAVARLPDRFDAIIADEGQDFDAAWWAPLESLLSDSERGIFYIFYDDNQRIYERREHYPVPAAPYVLTQNCRNTQAIHRTVMSFYRAGATPSCLGPAGRMPEIVPCRAGSEEPAALLHVLRHLTGQEKVSLESVIVLTPCSPQRSHWQDGLRIGEFELTWDLQEPGHRVLCCSIPAFKGLERPVVVLTELARMTKGERDMLLYVALSRARHHLVVLGNTTDIRAAIPEGAGH